MNANRDLKSLSQPKSSWVKADRGNSLDTPLD